MMETQLVLERFGAFVSDCMERMGRRGQAYFCPMSYLIDVSREESRECMYIVCFACFVPDAEEPVALRAFYIDEKDAYIAEYPEDEAYAFFARTPATFRQNPYLRREGDVDPQEGATI